LNDGFLDFKLLVEHRRAVNGTQLVIWRSYIDQSSLDVTEFNFFRISRKFVDVGMVVEEPAMLILGKLLAGIDSGDAEHIELSAS